MTTIKNLTRAAALVVLLIAVIALLSAVCFAEAPNTSEVTSDVTDSLSPDTSVPESSAPSGGQQKEELEEQIKDAVNKTDEYLSGNVWWEAAKTWIIENLSTVAGLIMAVAAVGTAMFARVGLIPRAVNTVTAFGDNCQSKFDNILSTVESDSKSRSAFIKNAEQTLAKMQEQADENASLRGELAESRKQVIALCEQKAASEKALTEASVMIAEALESVVEISSVAQVRKDAIFSRLAEAKKRIRTCQETDAPQEV